MTPSWKPELAEGWEVLIYKSIVTKGFSGFRTANPLS